MAASTDPPADPPAGKKRKVRKLGPFRIIEELGRGGMGIVYRAIEESLDREVALKVLPSFAGMEPSAVARFKREAEAAGRLSHPGIVPVFQVGEVRGVHYYSMELIEGASLEDLLDDLAGRTPGRMTRSLVEESGRARDYPTLVRVPGESAPGEDYVRSCAAIIADVASALAAAHTHQIIHRDLKPSNIILHDTGQPMLLDFGLARMESSVDLTRSGDAVGTPSYMAPEQARGERDVDARVDVYGLGALLYELLTLVPPHDGTHAGEIMRKILDEDIVPVRDRNERVPRDLETIVHMALEYEPDHRYAAIEAFEMDLRAFLDGRPVQARSPTAIDRFSRFVRRNRRALIAGVGAVVVTALVAVGAGAVALERSRADGRAAIDAAIGALLQQRDPAAATEHFGRASALLGDDRALARARLALAEEALSALYDDPAGRPLVNEFVAAFPPGERALLDDGGRARLGQIRARIEGIGELVIDAGGGRSDRFLSMDVRRVGDDGVFDGGWRPLPADGVLGVGELLLRAQRPGYAPQLRRIEVERDARTELRLRWLPEEAVPEGMVSMHHPALGALAVAAGETSCEQYRAMLAGVGDAQLRTELLPSSWPEGTAPGAPDAPVIGLSFRQARAAAALLGGHLPDASEYRLATSAGLGLRYPWGGVAGDGGMVADPDQRSAPEAVTHPPGGASIHGVLHLLGNAAEILAPAPGGPPLLAGGHFQSDPDRLFLGSRHLVQELDDARDASQHAGMRLARFLPPVDQPELRDAFDQRCRAILESGAGSILHTWDVGAQARIEHRLLFTGTLRDTDRRQVLPLVTRGFQQLGAPTVQDGHGRKLAVGVRRSHDGEGADLAIDLAVAPRRGQMQRLSISSWLRATGGLVGDGADHVLRLPVKATGRHSVVHAVVLPPGCAVIAADPPPDHRYALGGRWHLAWEFDRDAGGLRGTTVVLRLRCDGMLTASLPSMRSVRRAAERFFGAVREGDAEALVDLLDPSYLELPSGLDQRAAINRALAGDDWHFDVTPVLSDVTVVGDVITADFLVDWEARVEGRRVRVSRWPLRLQLVPGPRGPRALRLMPRPRADSGALLSDGSYEHDDLKVGLRPPPDVQLNRTRDELTGMQVTLVRDPRSYFQVLGFRADDDMPPAAVPVWLTAGAVALRVGRRVGDPVVSTIGPPGHEIAAEGHDRVFGGAGAWSVERWILASKGTRHFLLRAVAKGDTAAAARQEFDAHEGWFEAMARRVHIR